MRILLASLVAVLALCASSHDPALASSPARTTPLAPVPYVPLPASFDDLPQGPSTTLPWWQAGKLHVGDAKISSTFSRMDSRAGTVVVGKGGGGGHLQSIGDWYLVVGDHLKRLPTSGSTSRPLISADGRWLAWLDVHATRYTDYKDDIRYRLAIYDVQEREVVGSFKSRRRVAWEDGINGIWLRSLDNRGRAFFTLGNAGPHIWKPGRRPVPVTGTGSDWQTLHGWPKGIMWSRDTPSGGKGVYGTVDRSGRFTEAGEVGAPSGGIWSPDGSAFLSTDYDASTFWVDRILDGTSVQLGAPAYAGNGLRTVGWESETAAILWLHDAHGDAPISLLIRCDAVTGDCERVAGGPRLGSRSTMQEFY